MARLIVIGEGQSRCDDDAKCSCCVKSAMARALPDLDPAISRPHLAQTAPIATPPPSSAGRARRHASHPAPFFASIDLGRLARAVTLLHKLSVWPCVQRG